jgi:AcrR family transcriptional regulator
MRTPDNRDGLLHQPHHRSSVPFVSSCRGRPVSVTYEEPLGTRYAEVRYDRLVTLVERKQRQARQRIVEVAEELFLASGFDNVSVSEIAERAEVGRTTFFRHFGDKQEVLFSKSREQLAIIAAADLVDVAPARSASEAIEQLRPIVLAVLALATADPEGYIRHFQIIEQNSDLQGREAAKVQQMGDKLSQVLIHRGTAESTALFSAQIALACFQTAKALGNNPRSLMDDTEDAFARVLTLGAEPKRRNVKTSKTG